MSKKTSVDNLFSELSGILPPFNSGEITQKELNDLVAYVTEYARDSTLFARYNQYDMNTLDYYKKAIALAGIDTEEANFVLSSVTADFMPLLMRLKYHFERPRPCQLAFYYQLSLYTVASKSSDSPSYPSSHAYLSKIISEIIGNLYPKFYQPFRELHHDVCMSRMYMGLHYQSDVDMGVYCAERVLENRDVMKKYKL